MPMGNPSKIMLIEDDASMRSVLRTLLEIEGYLVSAANMSGGKEILDQMRRDQPDIVLLDVNLHGSMSGLEILRGMRADPSLSATRVVMSSGMDLRDQCLDSGADDFLLKPYMPDELLDKLRSK